MVRLAFEDWWLVWICIGVSNRFVVTFAFYFDDRCHCVYVCRRFIVVVVAVVARFAFFDDQPAYPQGVSIILQYIVSSSSSISGSRHVHKVGRGGGA